MIQINPLKSYIDGGVRAALTTPPSASLVFDLPGKAIWVKGVKLKGTDHTYTFSHDNYITLTNTPDSNESEDIKIGVNTNALKNAIDTTYGVVSTTANGLAPKFTSGNKLAAATATTYYFLGWAGSTLKWYQAPFRNVRINSETTDRLGVNSTDPLIISSGNGISVTWDSTNKKIVITNTKPDVNHNTHYTTMLYIGENNDTKANKNVANPYLKLFDDNTRRATFQIKAGSGIAVASDTNGNITITNSSPDVNHNTDRTGIKLTTVSGTKKTDSTLILANSTTGLNIQGDTNKFLIGNGTNYIEVPVVPSVSNKDATIGTTLTTLTTIAGVDIKAKIASYSLSSHTHSVKINGSTKTIAASGAVDLGNYLPLSGGTMGGTAWIAWPDSGNWSNNSDVTFPVTRGGLQWSGLSDYVKLFTEETSSDNLNLVLQFGDDNSNGLSIRNASNVQTSYISAGGIITTKTFKGNLDWSYITNKPSSYTPSAHTHAWNSLTNSSTTENQAILTNGSANGWKLYTLNISGWNNAANNAHSHSNKLVLDGITSTLVSNWNTAYNFVNTISETDTDKVINKWDEIVNFLIGISEDDKLNTLLNSKLSVYKLADNTNVGAIKNNGIYYSTTDASSDTLLNSPFNNGFTLINMTSHDGGDDLRRSRLAFNAYGEIKVSNDRGLANTSETWYNILTSKNTYISENKGYINGTQITYVNDADKLDGLHWTAFPTAGAYDIGDFSNFNDRSFVGSIYASAASSPTGSSIWFNTVQIAHRNGERDGTGYISQIAIGMTDYRNCMWFRGSRTGSWTSIITSANISNQSVNYATSAGNADKLDGYHANGLLTTLSNSNNGISITVGGTTKSISNISVNYASSAGNADTLDGLHANAFAAASHSHPYLPLSGGTMTGLIVGNNNGGSWIIGRSNSALYQSRNTAGDWHPVIGFKTKTGSWEFGSVGNDDIATFSWGSDSNYNSKKNVTTQVNLRAISGTIALTSEIPTKASWNYDDIYSKLEHTHDDRYYTESEINSKLGAYLPLSGGTMTGNIKYTAIGTSYIGNGANDAANGVGGALNNLVISSWWGVSFTTSCSEQTYTNKNAVSINCRNGYVYANTFVGAFSGNASSATALSSVIANDKLPERLRETTTSYSGRDANTIPSNGFYYCTSNINGLNNANILQLAHTNSSWRHQLMFKFGGTVGTGTDYDGKDLWTRLYNGSSKTWTKWYRILTSGNFNAYSPKLDGTGASGTWNISITGNAATATNADKLDGYHANAFALVGHTHNYDNIYSKLGHTHDDRYYTESEVNNLLSNKLNISNFNWTNLSGKLVVGNEFNIVNDGFNTSMWFNHSPINDRSKTASINGYHFGNGAGGYTSIKASGFIKNGSNGNYVLLGDGEHKAISDFSMSHSHPYLPLAGGTLTGNLTMKDDKRITFNSSYIYQDSNGYLHICPSEGLIIENDTSFENWNISMGSLRVLATVYASHFYEHSDIRYKRILKNLLINSNTIATLPLFDFEWIENNTIGTGTSALAVQQILPNIVSGTDKLTLDYGVLGTIAGITACKELVKVNIEIFTLKSELLQLKEKVKLLEDKLRKYENI